MKPIVISYPGHVDNEVEAIVALFEAGLEVLHVRKPAFSQEQMKNWIEAIDEKYRPQIVIHSHLELVEELGLRGVHFTSYNRHLMDNYSDKALPKSISVHSMTELVHLSEAFNYALISPVFESISKEGYGPAVDKSMLKTFLGKAHEVPVFALGGLDMSTVDEARELGFDGAALHGHIWVQFEKDHDVAGLVNRYREVKEKWE